MIGNVELFLSELWLADKIASSSLDYDELLNDIYAGMLNCFGEGVSIYAGAANGRPIMGEPYAMLYSSRHSPRGIREDQDRGAAYLGQILGLDGPVKIQPVCRPTDATAEARALVARRRQADYACIECGKSFRSTVHKAGSVKAPRYCGPGCEQRARRARRRAGRV